MVLFMTWILLFDTSSKVSALKLHLSFTSVIFFSSRPECFSHIRLIEDCLLTNVLLACLLRRIEIEGIDMLSKNSSVMPRSTSESVS